MCCVGPLRKKFRETANLEHLPEVGMSYNDLQGPRITRAMCACVCTALAAQAIAFEPAFVPPQGVLHDCLQLVKANRRACAHAHAHTLAPAARVASASV